MNTLTTYNSCSDFVFKAIPHIYPTGYTVVMNCWFDFWDDREAFAAWMADRLATCTLPPDHPLRKQLPFLRVGCCLIYNADNLPDAEAVYDTFADPDHYYVTLWENGEITNENT